MTETALDSLLAHGVVEDMERGREGIQDSDDAIGHVGG